MIAKAGSQCQPWLPCAIMTIGERFWSKVDVRGLNECWLWQARLFTNGYGQFKQLAGNRNAHRVAFELWWGVALPRWLQVCHDCPGGDNKACCNPAHMFLSDAKGHGEDRALKGQMPRGDQNWAHRNPEKVIHVRGEEHGRSKLSEVQVIAIMARFLQGARQRRIAGEFGVSPATICLIVNGQIWDFLFRSNES